MLRTLTCNWKFALVSGNGKLWLPNVVSFVFCMFTKITCQCTPLIRGSISNKYINQKVFIIELSNFELFSSSVKQTKAHIPVWFFRFFFFLSLFFFSWRCRCRGTCSLRGNWCGCYKFWWVLQVLLYLQVNGQSIKMRCNINPKSSSYLDACYRQLQKSVTCAILLRMLFTISCDNTGK